MAKLILHVGMPKTGSSYIQGVINKNFRLLESHNNIRFLTGRAPHVIACHLISDPNVQSRSDIHDLKESYSDKLREDLINMTNNTDVVFISSEYFVLCDNADIINYFSEIFDNMEILITVRRQDKLIASGYNQDIKALGRVSNLTWSYESSKLMDYWEYCESWDELDVPLKAIDYDLVKKDRNGLILSFMDVLEIDYKKISNQIVSPNNSSSNYSLTHREVLLKLACNRANLDDSQAQIIIKEFKGFWEDKEEFRIPKLYEKVIASSYKANNKKFIEKYLSGNEFSELNFHDCKGNTDIDRFSWNPLVDFEEILRFMINKIDKENLSI